MKNLPRYTIRTVDDFKRVPPERLRCCLEDFNTWVVFFDWEQFLRMYRRKHPILYFLRRDPPRPEFVWVDVGRPHPDHR